MYGDTDGDIEPGENRRLPFGDDRGDETRLGLRPYQVTARDRAIEELLTKKSTLLVMSTGTGKTHTLCDLIRDWEGRCLILAENREIVYQNARTAREVCQEPVGIEMADLRAWSGGFLPRIVCGTVQTLKSNLRCLSLRPETVTLVVCDEAHHFTAPIYKTIMKRFPNAKILGVTATPDRLYKKGIEKYFDSTAFTYSILDGINDGYLAPIRQRIIMLEELYLDTVRTVGGDLDQRQLSELLEQDRHIHAVANYLVSETEGRQTLVFSPTVKCAHFTAELLNRDNPECAVAIDATTPKDERKAKLEAYSKGHFRFLLNYGVFLEGWDCYRVGCVAMARPTKSRQVYAQAVGRGTRVCPSCGCRGCEACGNKRDLLVLDFVGQSKRHKLVNCFSLIEDGTDPRVARRAAKSAAKEPIEIRMALAAAAREMAEEERRRRARIYSVGNYKSEVSDPFSDPEAVSISTEQPGGGVTSTQMQFLSRHNLWQDGLTRNDASAIIGEYIERQKNGVWSRKQESLIRRLGYRGQVMTKENATRWLSWRLKRVGK